MSQKRKISEIINRQLGVIIKAANLKNKAIDKAIENYHKRNVTVITDGLQPDGFHCLFDWAIAAEKGYLHGQSFIKFVEDQVLELLAIIDNQFTKQVRNTIRELIVKLESDPTLNNNPMFMNFLGEIVGLNFILQKENERFQLTAIERKLPNSKSTDFEFLSKIDNQKILIEFVSIHRIDCNKLNVYQDLIDFLIHRFNQKIESKTQNVDHDLHQIIMEDGSKLGFMILPIIWKETVKLLPYKQAFEELNEKYINVFPCMSLHPQLLDDGTTHFSFTAVSHILERWESQEN